MRIAVIPARGGSKRIPHKNIKEFSGKPMIAWSIQAAAASDLFDRIIVSTDDAEIARVSMAFGGDVPFMRPASLADDHTGMAPVMSHALHWSLAQGWAVSEACCIHAAAPFIRPDDLRRGLEALQSGDWSYAISVAEFTASIFRAFRSLPQGGLQMFFPEHMLTRSQDLPTALHDAAQFYWGTRDAWERNEPIFSAASVPVIIPRTRVQDIDTPADWMFAESLFKLRDNTLAHSE
jgi:pseudaminic acid cytidylyltransferase